MRLGLSEISTIGATFEEDVAAYAAAGFDAIGIWEFKLPEDDDANIELLRTYGLQVANCVPAVPSVLPLGIPGMEGPADYAERLEALCASVRRLAQYAPECVACLTGPLGRQGEPEGRSLVIDALRGLARVADAHDVRLGFEPISPHQRLEVGFVHTVADAAALLDEAGLPQVGVLVDTFNLWEDGAAAAWLRAHGDRIAGLHIADLVGADDLDRRLPGTLGPRTLELVTAARDGGWDGTLDVEIFSTSQGFWGLSVGAAASQAFDAVSLLARS